MTGFLACDVCAVRQPEQELCTACVTNRDRICELEAAGRNERARLTILCDAMEGLCRAIALAPRQTATGGDE